MDAQTLSKTHTLAEALPWIRRHHGATVVVKIGGEALEDPKQAASVAGDLALLALVGMRLVVVHGGGPQVSRAMDRAGIEPSFVGGLRVTTAESIDIVKSVLIGQINFELVGLLRSAGLAPVGLSGADGGLLTAEVTAGPGGEDIGMVGRVTGVNAALLDSLLENGYTPVVASIAPDADGGPLNVNADAAAGSIAGAMGASKLVYLTNIEGLYADLGAAGSLISGLQAEELRALLPGLSAGMRPKAASILHALDHGAGKAHIIDGRVEHALLLEVFTDEGVGTQVLGAAE